jgi:hypothetical protein
MGRSCSINGEICMPNFNLKNSSEDVTEDNIKMDVKEIECEVMK